MNDLIRKAMEWGERGIPVFPCAADKSPLTKNGFYDAETDPQKIKALFEFYGDAAQMIGGKMGDGLFAVDVDLYKGEAPKAWLKAKIDSGELPETRIHETKSGGLHFLYEGEVNSCVPAEGVEVKGNGGYIILPGTPGYKVRSEGLVEAPQSLLEAIRFAASNTRGSTISQLEANVMSGADFHNSLTQLAAKLAAQGQDQVEIQERMLRLLKSSTASEPGHDRHARWRSVMADKGGELSRIAHSAYRKFNDDALMDEAGEASTQLGFEAFQEVAQQAGFHTLQNFEPKDVIKQEFDGETNPFEGYGYQAHEDVNVLDVKFSMYPILAENETVIISADPKTGKTAIMLTMALCISCGYDFGAFKTHEAGPTLYYGLEGRSAIRKRIEAWKLKTREQRQLPDTIPLQVVERATNLFKEDAQLAAAQQIVAYNKYCKSTYGTELKAIFIDTLTKAMIGGDQNSADDTAQLFNVINLIRDSGVVAPVVFVHHNAKDGKTRGSSNIEAEADLILGVQKQNDIVKMTITRARSVEDGASFSFILSGVDLGKNIQGYTQEGVYVEPLTGTVDEHKQEDPVEVQLIAQRREVITQLGETPSAKEVVEEWFQAGLLKGKNVRGATVAPSLETAAVQEALHKVANEPGGAIYGDSIIRPIYEDKKVIAFKVGKASF